MEDYSAYPERMSARTYGRMKAKEESGQSAKVDYVSHPLDKAPHPEPEPELVKTKTATTKKPTGKSAPARAKVEKKPAMTRKKTANPTPRKRSAGSVTLKIQPQYLAEKTIAEGAVPENTQGQKSADAARAEDSESDLSELAATPEFPTPERSLHSGSLNIKSQLDAEDAGLPNEPSFATPVPSINESNTIPALSEASDTSVLPSPSTPGLSVTSQAHEEIPSQLASQIALAALRAGPLVPITPAYLRHSGRSRAQPARFGDVVPTPVDVADSHDERPVAEVHDETISSGDSPTVLKVSRKKKSPSGTTAKPARRKNPVSQEKLSADDLADDVPAPKSRKRKAETSETTPRKRPSKAKDTTDATPKTKTRKTPAPRKKKEKTPAARGKALQLPSPPMSVSDYLEASGLSIDSELLQLSRTLTHREPLESKPEPCGKPEVWAPGRQELCETLPYYKSAHSGCYSNGNTVYAFMFDSSGVGREYMDQDVIIARMGGHMEPDPKTGIVSQKDDHLMEAKQPQSVMNNIIHKNSIVIICGDRNIGAITKMPHRYCVLGWFKPTHVWAEKTSAKKKIVTTIRYRFERLSRAEPSWYSTAPDLAVSPPFPDLELPIKTCSECQQSCPQVYLIDWMCTNQKCNAFWEMSNGHNAPYGDLDYHPAFLLHKTTWEREIPPFSLNPGVPKIGHHFGDNLSLVNTRGIVCPDCGRCNSRYMFTHWRCDTPGCRWKLQPKHEVVMPSNLGHTPWEMASDGPSLIKSITAPAIRTQVKYHSNYKVVKYNIEGVEGSVFVAKANNHVVSEPGGADDMFREMQTVDVGLERRMLRKTAAVEPEPSAQKIDLSMELSNTNPIAGTEDTVDADQEPEERPAADEDDEHDDHDDHKAEAGTRMNAFGMNFGMPYKFIASGDSQSFEDAPAAIRSARSLLNWAQRVFVNDKAGYQDFNEELIFGYMEAQKIKYHDDGEMGLGPRIATLSLGGGATMLLRAKAKYYSQVSNTGVFTFEEPLPLPLLESSGYTSGFRGKSKTKMKPCKDTHEGRRAAWAELKQLKDSGDTAGFRQRGKELSKELELKRAPGEPILSFHLTHGDIVIMEGEQIQKFLEHQVEPTGSLRFALTCRTVLGNHLTPDQLPKYDVADAEVYDGSAIRENGDGEAVVWD